MLTNTPVATDKYLKAFYLHLCAGFIPCMPHILWQCAHRMKDKHIILIASWCCYSMLPRAQVTAGGGQWGGIRGRSGGGEGDIEFHAPVRLQSVAALRRTMAPVEWVQIWVGPLPNVFNKNFRNKIKRKKHKLFFGKLKKKKSGFSFWKFSKFQIILSCRHASQRRLQNFWWKPESHPER